MAFNVIAVSMSVSPFLIEEAPTAKLKTSAFKRFPASSNEAKVLVEFSKNILICVMPLRAPPCFCSFLFKSTYVSAKSRIAVISAGGKCSIPNKCFDENAILLASLII